MNVTHLYTKNCHCSYCRTFEESNIQYRIIFVNEVPKIPFHIEGNIYTIYSKINSQIIDAFYILRKSQIDRA